MIRPDLRHCETLEQFYKEIREKQSLAHGREYIAHHEALRTCIQDKDVNMVKELGVCQGGTLAAMMLANPYQLTGYDIQPDYYEPYAHLFEEYAKEQGIVYNYVVKSSIDKGSVSNCDLLHIDSLHVPNHLMNELRLHAPSVKKYIVFHDTANYGSNSGILRTIVDYITEVEQSWTIIDHYTHSVGYTVIKREERIPVEYNDVK